MEDDIELVYSPLCQSVESDGHTVEVEIYSSGKNDWILEVVDADGNSIVWDGTFESDTEAMAEFTRTLEEEGIGSILGAKD